MINIKRKKSQQEKINLVTSAMKLAQEIGKCKKTHATLRKKWNKEGADDEKEALTEEKIDSKISYEIPNKYHE